MKRETIDFSAMCRELVEDAEILALQQNIKTKSEISPGIEVRGNELYLLRTLLNLLDNTMKYNVDGGTVSISATKSSSQKCFSELPIPDRKFPWTKRTASLNGSTGPTQVVRPKWVVQGWGLAFAVRLYWLTEVRFGWSSRSQVGRHLSLLYLLREINALWPDRREFPPTEN